ncbi:MAG: M16 family metallopeptidase [Bacteroidales bacterium]
MEYLTHTLPNGIRLVHYPVKSHVAHFGFVVHTGSRDELPGEHGMAHFIEHVIFKGTQKRKAWHVLSRLEDVGGEINAYTTKEDTCVYASFLKNDYQRAIELIFDICFHSIFPQKEINKEKSIIIDEILSYKDSPYELIFDDFEEQVFNGHAIGRNILGDETILAGFSRKSIFKFITDNYSTDEMVLSSVGNISFPKLIKLAEKYFGEAKHKTRIRNRVKPNSYQPEVIYARKNTHQTHCALGNTAYDAHNEKRTGLALLNNLLGGPGLNTRLNLSLREKHGYSYHVESQYTSYSDTGIITVYFGCDKEKFKKSLNLVLREFKVLREKKLGTLQLSKAKKQLLGQVAIAADSHEHLMLTMGKSILLNDKVDSMEEVSRKIENVSASNLLEIANEILDKNKISILQYH